NSSNRSSIYRLSHIMSPTPAQLEEHPIYLYSNFNFTDVKRELQVLNPPTFQVQDHSQSMTGALLPPGLRFPTGAIAGQHLLLSGTYLTNAQQSFSIWSLNLSSLVWTRIDTGTVFSSGSWNRGLLLEDSNEYLVFGNKTRSLADDYQNRQTNFEHVSIVDLEAFGIYKHPPTTMTQTAQELGLGLLNDQAMADFEILTTDQQRVPVNSAILAARWPYFGALLREQEEQDATNLTSQPSSSTALNGNSNDTNNNANGNGKDSNSSNGRDLDSSLFAKRTLLLPEPYTVVLAFLQYLYTDHLVTAQQHHPQVLSQLLLLADMYGLDRLRDLATHALHQMLNMSTAAMVYETAALSQQTGLQIRSLKVMIAAKKMLQQQQLKLQQQQQQLHGQGENGWRTAEQILHPPHPGHASGQNPYNSHLGIGQHYEGGLQFQQQQQYWNTEPLTPPPASPPPPVAGGSPNSGSTTPKPSFFSFPGSRSKTGAIGGGSSTAMSVTSSSGASMRSGVTGVSSVSSGTIATDKESDMMKKKKEEQHRQEVMQRMVHGSYGVSYGPSGFGGPGL
ncbi:hypothetical protein BGW38_007477, partial [Lunasporangiospora selenospora]